MATNRGVICFVNSNKEWGGGEKWHFTALNYFAEHGYQSYMVTHPQSKLQARAHQNGLTTVPVKISNLSFLNPFKLVRLCWFFRKHRVQTVIMNLPSDLKTAGIAAKLAGVKTIIYRRGMPKTPTNTWLNRLLFCRILSWVVVNSQEIARTLVQGNESWFPQDKLFLVYNGVDTSVPPPTAQPFTPTTQHQPIVLGTAGRLVEQKGQLLLVELCQQLKAAGYPIKLLIAGEGPLQPQLEAAIEQAGLNDTITLLGRLERIDELMNAIDIFVFPSQYEGSANALIEALYYQKPVVAFDVSSNPEVVSHDETGLLAPAFDVTAMALLVMRYIDQPELQQRCVNNGYQRLLERFDINHNLAMLEKRITAANDE